MSRILITLALLTSLSAPVSKSSAQTLDDGRQPLGRRPCRIFAGQHFRFDLTAGQNLGRQVADFALDNILLPRRGDQQSDAASVR